MKDLFAGQRSLLLPRCDKIPRSEQKVHDAGLRRLEWIRPLTSPHHPPRYFRTTAVGKRHAEIAENSVGGLPAHPFLGHG